MINTFNALQRVHQATFEIYITHFAVACSPEQNPLNLVNLLHKIASIIRNGASHCYILCSHLASLLQKDSTIVIAAPINRNGACQVFVIIVQTCYKKIAQINRNQPSATHPICWDESPFLTFTSIST